MTKDSSVYLDRFHEVQNSFLDAEAKKTAAWARALTDKQLHQLVIGCRALTRDENLVLTEKQWENMALIKEVVTT